MAERIEHFLLVFDHEQGRLIETLKFGQDADAAVAAYAAKEAEYGDEKLIEVVLVGSDSFETVKLTHANYFDSTVSVSKYLASWNLSRRPTGPAVTVARRPGLELDDT